MKKICTLLLAFILCLFSHGQDRVQHLTIGDLTSLLKIENVKAIDSIFSNKNWHLKKSKVSGGNIKRYIFSNRDGDAIREACVYLNNNKPDVIDYQTNVFFDIEVITHSLKENGFELTNVNTAGKKTNSYYQNKEGLIMCISRPSKIDVNEYKITIITKSII